MTGSKRVDHWTSGLWNCVWVQWDCRAQGTGIPPSSRLCQLWRRKEDLQRAWNRDRRAVWDQVGLSHCWHDGLVTVQDKARLRRGHNDQTRRGHQCSETTVTGESRFYISIPLGIEPGSLMTGSKRVDHWASGTVCECSEIAGSPQLVLILHHGPCRISPTLARLKILEVEGAGTAESSNCAGHIWYSGFQDIWPTF